MWCWITDVTSFSGVVPWDLVKINSVINSVKHKDMSAKHLAATTTTFQYDCDPHHISKRPCVERRGKTTTETSVWLDKHLEATEKGIATVVSGALGLAALFIEPLFATFISNVGTLWHSKPGSSPGKTMNHKPTYGLPTTDLIKSHWKRVWFYIYE